MTKDTSARTRAILEAELGEVRQFSALSAREIEAVADRLARALNPALAVARTQAAA